MNHEKNMKKYFELTERCLFYLIMTLNWQKKK